MKHLNLIICSLLLICAAICGCSPKVKERTKQLNEIGHKGEIVWINETQGSFVDVRDNKRYRVVKTGTQTWFAENLAYKVNSGCWAYNNNGSSVHKYGYLYNWETAKNVCPEGWHLPCDSEWAILTDYLGGEKIAGGKLKASSGWKYDANGKPANSSGFNALPTGRRDGLDGTFSHFGESTSFWSATPIDSMNAVSRGLHYNSEDVHYGTNSRKSGFCVRCLKDMR
jgi:uncharacterized protein (TIGR02145 family)